MIAPPIGSFFKLNLRKTRSLVAAKGESLFADTYANAIGATLCRISGHAYNVVGATRSGRKSFYRSFPALARV
jgi:hypothetical protein